jgi:polyisoprenoid-binding protein YceI
MQSRAVPDGRVVSGMLSFDGHATAGDFTGTTDSVSGKLLGASEITAVRGWVEAPVRTLQTGNDRRDRDLNKSMESERFPVIRFDLSRLTPTGGTRDSLRVVLAGTLFIHGVRRNVELPGTIQFEGSRARVRSEFPLNLKDYRIGGLSRLLGLLKMYEDIEVHVDVVFEFKEDGSAAKKLPGSVQASGPPAARGAVSPKTSGFTEARGLSPTGRSR